VTPQGDRAGGQLAYSGQFNNYERYTIAYLLQACPLAVAKSQRIERRSNFVIPGPAPAKGRNDCLR
jgi:hypothetical protein